MASHVLVPFDFEVLLFGGIFSVAVLTTYFLAYYGGPYVIFAYNCFLKPIKTPFEKVAGQQAALESFYKGQAAVYDATRARLLRGREEMLALAAAQLTLLNKKEGHRKRVWVDIGGGTGWNIEQLNKYLPLKDSFSEVWLVDFSPSQCAVARDRFKKLGWANVTVVCMDARRFTLGKDEHTGEMRKADWITMSYSLSMIPTYYSVIDSLTKLLSPAGIISVADFYVQSSTSLSSKSYTGGVLGRHVNWFSRQFWRIWFEFDRVNLDESRRDYLEYQFGTILNVNERNVLFGGIPYYIWVGRCKSALNSTEELAELDAAATNSPYLSPVRHREDRKNALLLANASTALQLRSKGYEAAVLNLSTNLPLPSFYYQNQRFRLHYDEMLPKHTIFKNSYIYAFTWEDARVDRRLLKLTPDDVVLAITSAGDNILDIILSASPRRVHAVDLNPAQGHLLELKLACFSAGLPYDDIWHIFGEGRHPQFHELLISRISPHLSSHAFQFWLERSSVFNSFTGNGLYRTGQSGIALGTTKWLFRLAGITSHVKRLCAASTLNEQREIWRDKVRPVMLSRWVSRLVIGNERFLWKALGVPANQRNMFLADYPNCSSGEAMWKYVVNTLDPVVESSIIGDDNYFYLLCLLGHYTKRCHPSYLSQSGYLKLSTPGAFDGLRLHTDELNEVLVRLKSGQLTCVIIMDSMDWFTPGGEEAKEQVRRINRAMKVAGRVLLRSAGLRPWYISVFEEEGFAAKRVGTRTEGVCIDRVNMYASTWVCTKRTEITEAEPLEDTEMASRVELKRTRTVSVEKLQL